MSSALEEAAADSQVIRVPGYEGPDRRKGYNAWRRAVQGQLAEVTERTSQLRHDLNENTAATKSIKDDTSEMLELFRALKGAFTVLNWVGKLAKPLAALAMAGASFAALWASLKGGPPPGGLK